MCGKAHEKKMKDLLGDEYFRLYHFLLQFCDSNLKKGYSFVANSLYLYGFYEYSKKHDKLLVSIMLDFKDFFTFRLS